MPEGAQPNKCYTEWDFCNSGSEAENAYHWQLGWCAAAVERGAMLGELGHCMRGEAPPTRAAPLPDETTEPRVENVCVYRRADWPSELLTYLPPHRRDLDDLHCIRWSLTPYGWPSFVPPPPPGYVCFLRSPEWPFHCLASVPNQATQTANAAATATAG